MTDSRRGQILPLFALSILGLFAVAALAVDVSGVYAARLAYRTAADAASLAGAQDLQKSGTRAVGADEYANARQHAMDSVEAELGGTAQCLAPVANKSICTLTDPVTAAKRFDFEILTPLPNAAACVSCDPARSVQVTIANPSYNAAFANILGIHSFRIAVSSVAGLTFNHAYTIVMLRPPTSTSVSGVRDIEINGGTKVFVVNGEVASNANMVYSGTNSQLYLDSGFNMYYFDPANPPLWGSDPTGVRLAGMVADPNYPVPSRGSSPPAGGLDPDSIRCLTIAQSIYANAGYAPSVPAIAGVPDMTKISCYTPGVYPIGGGGDALAVPNGTLAILEPGLYFFDGILDAQGSVIGGYTPNSPGVALVFRESEGTQFKNRTSGGSSTLEQIVALNAGTKYLNSGGSEATAALDYDGNPVQTNTTPPLLMTVIVPPDPRCPVSLPLAASCTNTVENQNKAIDLSGGSGLYLAGVQYAPSDNISIAGNSATGGYIGQVWGWTAVYTGGSIINQEGSTSAGPGTLRLDGACTAPSTPCLP